MRKIADVLGDVLRQGDEQGRNQIRARHLPEHLLEELAQQTHQYAVEHAGDVGVGKGWLVFSDGIEGWWTPAGDLADGQFKRLYMLRADVVKRLEDQGLAHRPNPRSTPLHVRRGEEKPSELA